LATEKIFVFKEECKFFLRIDGYCDLVLPFCNDLLDNDLDTGFHDKMALLWQVKSLLGKTPIDMNMRPLFALSFFSFVRGALNLVFLMGLLSGAHAGAEEAPALPSLKVKKTSDLPSTAQQQDVFGIVTWTDATQAMVGAPWDSDAAYRAGALYLYQNQGESWGLVKKILPPTPSARAMFGSAVDANASYIAVGAAAESAGKLYNTGAVYILDRKTGAVLAKLNAEKPKSGDFFGNAVRWLDENTLAISAHLSDVRGIDSGSVSIFQKEGEAWKEAYVLAPKALHAGSLFGNVLTSSGDFLAVGAYGQDSKTGPGSGAVFVFKKDAKGLWMEKQILRPDVNKVFTEFGGSVAMQGKALIVGAAYEDGSAKQMGTVYSFVYDETAKAWVLRQKLNNPEPSWQGRFGGALALNNNRLFIGAPFGVVYGYHQERFDTDWVFAEKFSKTDPDYQNLFPQTLFAAGDHLLVGVPVRQSPNIPTGAAHILTWEP
jgi:hypothetical protein